MIRTCSTSLLTPGRCCDEDCVDVATVAVLDDDMVEHARCGIHIEDAVAVKPLTWSAVWAPAGDPS